MTSSTRRHRPPRARRSRDPLIKLLFTLSDELADLGNAACKVDALRADLDHSDQDHPVHFHRPSDAVDAAIGGDTPALLSRLHRLAPEAAYRAASSASLDRHNALGMLRGLADTTLLARNAKPLPA